MIKARIVMTAPGRGEVFIDGIKVPHLNAFSLECKAGEYNKLRLELFAEEVEFEGEVDTTCIDSSETEHAVTKIVGLVSHE